MTESVAPPVVDPGHTERYNALLSPKLATLKFRIQLKRAFPELDYPQALRKLLVELGPYFWEGQAPPKYQVWLVHGHYNLEPDEKMVSRPDWKGKRDTMQPMKVANVEVPPRLAVERWDYDRVALEHRLLDVVLNVDSTFQFPQPSEKLWDGFRRITEARGITALGVAVAPDYSFFSDFHNGYRFVERTGAQVVGDRMHTTKFERLSTNEEMIESAWVPINPKEGDMTEGTPIDHSINPLFRSWLSFTTFASGPVVLEDPKATKNCTHDCGANEIEKVDETLIAEHADFVQKSHIQDTLRGSLAEFEKS